MPRRRTALQSQAASRRDVKVRKTNSIRDELRLRRAFSLTFPAGGMVLFIHWRVVAEEFGAAFGWRRRFLFYGMTAAMAAAAAS